MEEETKTDKPQGNAAARGSAVKRLVSWFICKFRGHAKRYWSKGYCEKERVLSGRFRPWFCSRCGYESAIVRIPPMPPCKPPLDMRGARRMKIIETLTLFHGDADDDEYEAYTYTELLRSLRITATTELELMKNGS